MHRTLFTTPVVRTVLRALSLRLLRWSGWTVEGRLDPLAARSVVIGAPHTSNWDLPWTLMTAYALDLNLYWMGKDSLFKPPFGPLMRWLGGIAVDRSRSTGLVAASVAALQSADGPVQLAVPPAGTRSDTVAWKTGFHFIARGAGVPIVLAYMDYGQRRVGLGPLFWPTDDVEGDIRKIRAFYEPMRGRNASAAAPD